MYLNFLILPLLSIIIIGLLGRYLGNQGILRLILLKLTILINLSILLIYEYNLDGIILTINLLKFKDNLINYYLYLDDLSQLMLFVVILISFIVLIYSYDYMITDPHINRFYLYILLFVFFMIILITTNSLPILFIGWEGVGLSSFLLISFWFTRFQAQLGGLLALLMNRIGDIFYLLGLFLSISWLGSSDIISLSILSFNINWDYILICFFIAAMAKSAQIYLHLWLPYSMEGPTPISALIHAATMVTAGVFLLLRLNQLILISYWTCIFIIFIGGLTAFIGGTLALISIDLKELIAYSTMSQLGYMIIILGLKGNNFSFYHLLFHAYFKALLFLTAGAIIHTIIDLQDFRKTGGLLNLLYPQTIFSIIALTSLIGFPFTIGFYSKESILNNSFNIISLMGQYSYIILIISAGFTILYSYRFFIILFLGETKLSIFLLKYLHSSLSLHLIIPLIILSFITIIISIIFQWIHINTNSFYILTFSYNTPILIKLIPLILILIIPFIFKFLFNPLISFFLPLFFNINLSFFLLYTFISGIFFALSYRVFFKLFDYGFLDYIFIISFLQDNKLNYKYSINPLSLLLFILSFFLIF